MPQWLGSRKIVFVPMIRPTDPEPIRTSAAIAAEVRRRVLFDPANRQRTFSEHVNRISHGRAGIDPVILPPVDVPFTDLLYGPNTSGDAGVDLAMDIARDAMGGNPGVDYVVCSIGQANDAMPQYGYAGTPGAGGTSKPGRGWFRTHVQAQGGEFVHEACHVVAFHGDYYYGSVPREEWLNPFDPMSTGSAHVSVLTKRLLGWLPPSDVKAHPGVGVAKLRLRPHAMFSTGAAAFGVAAMTAVAGRSVFYIELRLNIDQFEGALAPEHFGVLVYEVQAADIDTGPLLQPLVRLRDFGLRAGATRAFAQGRLRVTVERDDWPFGADVAVTVSTRAPDPPSQPGASMGAQLARMRARIAALELEPEGSQVRQELRRLYSRENQLEQLLRDAGCGDQ